MKNTNLNDTFVVCDWSAQAWVCIMPQIIVVWALRYDGWWGIRLILYAPPTCSFWHWIVAHLPTVCYYSGGKNTQIIGDSNMWMQGFTVYIKLPSASWSLERLKTSYTPAKAQNLRGKSRYVQIYSGPLLRFLFMLFVSPLISDPRRHNAVYHHCFIIKQYVFSCSMRCNFEKQNRGLKKKKNSCEKKRKNLHKMHL